MSEEQIISFLEFVNQDDEDKYNMLVESAAIIRQKENIIKEVREYIEKETKELYSKNKSCKYLGEIMQLEYILEILDKGE